MEYKFETLFENKVWQVGLREAYTEHLNLINPDQPDLLNRLPKDPDFLMAIINRYGESCAIGQKAKTLLPQAKAIKSFSEAVNNYGLTIAIRDFTHLLSLGDYNRYYKCLTYDLFHIALIKGPQDYIGKIVRNNINNFNLKPAPD